MLISINEMDIHELVFALLMRDMPLCLVLVIVAHLSLAFGNVLSISAVPAITE